METRNISERIYITNKDNTYQNYQLKNLLSGQEYRKISLNIKDRELKSFFTTGLQLEILVITVQVTELTNELLDLLKKIKLKKRVLILEVSKPFMERLLMKTLIDGHKGVPLPKFDSWADKESLCISILEKTQTKFEKADVLVNLARLMVRYGDLWDDIFLTLELARSSQQIITLEYLQEVYPELEFYSLKDWLEMIVISKHKQKTTVIANYFLETKQYNPSWLMRKIKEYYTNFGVVYQGYRKGIIFIEAESDTQIRERSSIIGWGLGEYLANMKLFEINRYIKLIEKVPYEQFIKSQKIVYTYGDYNVSKSDVYKCILELLAIQERVNVDEDKQGFQRK